MGWSAVGQADSSVNILVCCVHLFDFPKGCVQGWGIGSEGGGQGVQVYMHTAELFKIGTQVK